MRTHQNGRVYECVAIDVDTQRDFCDPSGLNPVANLEELIPALRRAIAWVKRNEVPLVSSIESHRAYELSDSGYPVCCQDGSPGQRKLDFTGFRRAARIEVDNTLSCPVDLFHSYQQVIFRKRTMDLLHNPKAERFLTQVCSKEFVIFGVGLELSIKALALGLLARGRQVGIAVDACGYWNRSTAELALRQLVAKGARAISLCELRCRKLPREGRYAGARSAPTAHGDGSRRPSTRRRRSDTNAAVWARLSPSRHDRTIPRR